MKIMARIKKKMEQLRHRKMKTRFERYHSADNLTVINAVYIQLTREMRKP